MVLTTIPTQKYIPVFELLLMLDAASGCLAIASFPLEIMTPIAAAAPVAAKPIMMLFAIGEIELLETGVLETGVYSCVSSCKLRIDESNSTFEVEASNAKRGEKHRLIITITKRNFFI
jgi:hypothetical protein